MSRGLWRGGGVAPVGGASSTPGGTVQRNSSSCSSYYPSSSCPTDDKPTDLDQNWTTDRIIAQLPRQTPSTTVRPDHIGLVIFRNSVDKTTLPDIIDAAYLQGGLTRREHGIKFSTKHSEINAIHQLVIL